MIRRQRAPGRAMSIAAFVAPPSRWQESGTTRSQAGNSIKRHAPGACWLQQTELIADGVAHHRPVARPRKPLEQRDRLRLRLPKPRLSRATQKPRRAAAPSGVWRTLSWMSRTRMRGPPIARERRPMSLFRRILPASWDGSSCHSRPLYMASRRASPKRRPLDHGNPH
jgi:hypothetical protein